MVFQSFCNLAALPAGSMVLKHHIFKGKSNSFRKAASVIDF
jgi:hypothetical protein